MVSLEDGPPCAFQGQGSTASTPEEERKAVRILFLCMDSPNNWLGPTRYSRCAFVPNTARLLQGEGGWPTAVATVMVRRKLPKNDGL